MKVCEKCGIEINGRDGENTCPDCDKETRSKARRARAREDREDREYVMESCGLVKVRGALGGTYWE